MRRPRSWASEGATAATPGARAQTMLSTRLATHATKRGWQDGSTPGARGQGRCARRNRPVRPAPRALRAPLRCGGRRSRPVAGGVPGGAFRDAPRIERDLAPRRSRAKRAHLGEVGDAVDLVGRVELVRASCVRQQVGRSAHARRRFQHGGDCRLGALIAREGEAGDVENHSMYPSARRRDSIRPSFRVARDATGPASGSASGDASRSSRRASQSTRPLNEGGTERPSRARSVAVRSAMCASSCPRAARSVRPGS